MLFEEETNLIVHCCNHWWFSDQCAANLSKHLSNNADPRTLPAAYQNTPWQHGLGVHIINKQPSSFDLGQQGNAWRNTAIESSYAALSTCCIQRMLTCCLLLSLYLSLTDMLLYHAPGKQNISLSSSWKLRYSNRWILNCPGWDHRDSLVSPTYFVSRKMRLNSFYLYTKYLSRACSRTRENGWKVNRSYCSSRRAKFISQHPDSLITHSRLTATYNSTPGDPRLSSSLWKYLHSCALHSNRLTPYS